jgi:tetratricopeptide (TPR) repeat protein
VRAGEETLRHSIAATTDPRTRARLRVDLAELLRARDAPAARAELDQALREGGPSGPFTAAALSFARSLPPADRLAWLTSLAQGDNKPDGKSATKTDGRATSPVLLSALAEAQLGADLPRDAALTWLALARDERVALHHRRAAARKVAQLGDRLAPPDARAAEAVSAELSVGKARRGPRSSPHENPEAGIPERKMSGAPSKPHGLSPRPRRARPAPTSLWDRAMADARAGQASRSRRLGEEALRAAASGPELNARVAALDTALREGGFIKDALRLRRTHLEALGGPGGTGGLKARPALLALAKEAEAAGLGDLAAEWRTDAGVVPVVSVAVAAEATSPEAHYLAAQRLLARDGKTDSKAGTKKGDVAAVLAHLEKALAGHPGADAALALAEKMAARVASSEADLGNRKLDLLRAAHAAEFAPARRGRLGRRLAETLEARGDALGAVAVLESALGEATSGVWMEPGSPRRSSSPASSRLDDLEHVRAERVRLLRSLGRSRELAAALEKDAGALQGEARLAVLAEHATLLEAAGEAEKALDVRLMALAEFPGAPTVLDDARRRLDATGRAGESLALATAALDHTTDTTDATDVARRRQLLRDVASLTEKAVGVDRSGAAEAWLAVLEVDPSDAQAADAAERFLVATGDWERCADLLAWLAARAPTLPPESSQGDAGSPSRTALLWRLAELRRARLGQIDEALRLYVELGTASRSALPPLVDPPALAAFVRREPVLAVETARAAVAPTAADRSRALLDRARAFAERGRRDDAERDALAALDFDPHNMEALGALEKFFEEPARARLLVDELGRKAGKLEPSAAAPLFYGRGRAAARAGDNGVAREAYRRAMSLDPTLAEPIAALGALASKEGDWSEVAKLLESEVGLTTSSARKGALLLELAVVQGDRLGGPARAVALLDDAARYLRDEPRVLDLRGRFNLAAGNWQAAAEALDQLATRSAAIPDAAERYFAVAAAAEAAGDVDRALTLYSRSYSRDGSYRPTLERLSAICFQRGQWDNAWKATEALLDRHAASIEPGVRATLLVRSALADLHVGQRVSAVAKLGEIVTRGPSYAPEAGIRDVAESWAGMHLEPRLLVTLEARRHERILRRAREAFALTDGLADEARRQALEILGALAMVDGRWEEAFSALQALGADTMFEPQRRAGFLVAAGDVMSRHYGGPKVAEPFYEQARALWPGHPRFGRPAQGVS